jgi:hypothetical protein
MPGKDVGKVFSIGGNCGIYYIVKSGENGQKQKRRFPMRKTVSGFIGLMCLIPFMAVAWQMDSSPFRWSTSSIKSSGAPAALQIVLQNKVNMASGTVTISYSLPSGAKNAKLRIYGISGKAVKDFDLRPGTGTMQWDIAKENVAAGIYMACMPFGNVVKKAVIAIVK